MLFQTVESPASAKRHTGMLHMLRVRTRVLQLVAVAMAFAAVCLPARAHPHVWVTVETTLLYENGAVVGIAHKWTFDELYTTMAVEGLDANKDGKYDRAELAELAKVNMEGLKDFGYFTHPVLAGEPVKLGEARDYWQEHKDGLLSLHFTVPFATPVLAEAKGLSFAVYDPTFFIAFDLAKTDPVRLGAGAPKDCALKVGMQQSESLAFPPSAAPSASPRRSFWSAGRKLRVPLPRPSPPPRDRRPSPRRRPRSPSRRALSRRRDRRHWPRLRPRHRRSSRPPPVRRSACGRGCATSRRRRRRRCSRAYSV
jgi:ABC-type uncharacterized transport system substrate-binding protein